LLIVITKIDITVIFCIWIKRPCFLYDNMNVWNNVEWILEKHLKWHTAGFYIIATKVVW
jgi:hypothetical protein